MLAEIRGLVTLKAPRDEDWLPTSC
jgi:hypothetical protein